MNILHFNSLCAQGLNFLLYVLDRNKFFYFFMKREIKLFCNLKLVIIFNENQI